MPKPIDFPFRHSPPPSDAKHIERTRRRIRESLDLLARREDNTFLGRKTFDPFPGETKEATDASDGRSAPIGERR